MVLKWHWHSICSNQTDICIVPFERKVAFPRETNLYFRKHLSKFYSFAVASENRQYTAACQVEKLQKADVLCHLDQVMSQ